MGADVKKPTRHHSRYTKYVVLFIFVVALFASIGYFDYVIYRAIQPLQRIDVFIALAEVGQFLGNRTGSVLLVALVIVLAASRWKRAALIGVVAALTQSVVVEALKALSGRLRPITVEEQGIEPGFYGPMMEGNSFPSGHATFAFTLAVVAAAFFPRARRVIYAIAVFIAISRIMLDKHYLSDVAAGAMIGWAIGSFFVLAWFPRTKQGVENTRVDG